ncbi:hypothetical protein VE03_00191 [Pseudogymnoascus sp. 23342-1-I1]|nr:hypothetical protein VE03_00191 [Pseudogymnoascus sp. 23342-1-I1]
MGPLLAVTQPPNPGRSRRACQEKLDVYQKSFIDMMECLQESCTEEWSDEEAAVLNDETTQNGETPDDLNTKLNKRSYILGIPETIAEECLKQLCYELPGPKVEEDRKEDKEGGNEDEGRNEDGEGSNEDEKGEKRYHYPIINLAELQRLNLYALRKKLAARAVNIIEHKSLSESEAWRIKGLMADYCNALRDFDYMQQKDSDMVESDPFHLTFSRWCDWAIMKPNVETIYKSTTNPLMSIPRDHEDPGLISDGRGWIRETQRNASFQKRFWFGIAGGLALIAPMLLILLHHDKVTALATASVATVMFAVTMAFYHEADASPLALVGATAAYSAVLIVLVGTKL